MVNKALLLEQLGPSAAKLGWGVQTLEHAASICGMTHAEAKKALPGNTTALIEAWLQSIDEVFEKMSAALPLSTFKVHDRIVRLVELRLQLLEPHRGALARLPAAQSPGATLSQAWRASSSMWTLAGDTSTDYNYYSKRTLLTAVYLTTLRFFVTDVSPDFADTRAFLKRRIEDVMRIGQVKRRLKLALT